MRQRPQWLIFGFLAAACALGAQGVGPAVAAAPGAAPGIDKTKLASYIRYAEAFTPSVQVTVGDPVPTALRGYYRLPVQLSVGQTKQDKTYYLTADGQHVLTGPIWDLADSPFVETASQLPSNGPSFGPADARITLVVFSDFQCPYCREFARTMRDKLPQKYPKDVRVVFKDFPIATIHPWAEAAAEAAHCVGDGHPDVFWTFHDWVFEHQGEWNTGNVREKTLQFAKDHGLDAARVMGCYDSHATRPEIDASLAEGRKLGIEQTPTFYLAGRTVSGALSWSSLDTLIQMEMNRPAFIPPAGAPVPNGTAEHKIGQ